MKIADPLEPFELEWCLSCEAPARYECMIAPDDPSLYGEHEVLDLKVFLPGEDCPECGAKGPYETNGEEKLADLSILCTACGLQTDLVDIIARVARDKNAEG